jgi:hypothetical protein
MPNSGEMDQSPRIWSTYQFLQLFTVQERYAILAAVRTDLDVAFIQQTFLSCSEIQTTDPLVEYSLTVLVAKGIITPERKIEIMES